MEGDRLNGTVFIAELMDPEEPLMLTGLFAGHLERDDDPAHPLTREVQAPAPGYPRASAAFLVEASTIEQVREIADEVVEQGLRALGPRFLRHRRAAIVSGHEVYPHRPGVDVKGPGVVH